jgi:hypothetical protein
MGEAGIKDVPAPHIQPELLEKIKDQTKHIFSHVDLDHPALKEIFRISVEHRSRNGNSEKEVPIPINGASVIKSDIQHR